MGWTSERPSAKSTYGAIKISHCNGADITWIEFVARGKRAYPLVNILTGRKCHKLHHDEIYSDVIYVHKAFRLLVLKAIHE